jgi:tetratricopeptide (TPR) repeat protein
MSPNGPIQKSLLTGEWEADEMGNLPEDILAAAKNVVAGAFMDHLTSPAVRALLTLSDNLDISKPFKTWFRFSATDLPAAPSRSEEFLLLITAVASLHAFIQINWTGPDLDIKLLEILTIPSYLTDKITEGLLQTKSTTELALGGEPAYHLAEASFLLRLAQTILSFSFQHIESAAWWRLRAYNIHSQVLDDTVVVPEGALPSFEPLAETYSSDPDLVGRLWLERGLLDYHQGNDRVSLEHFVRAARATDLQYELTGALGKRTKFQQTELSQLVLLAESRTREGGKCTAPKSTDILTDMPENRALNDDTLLEQTEYISSHPAAPGSRLAHLDPSSQPALHPLDQCIFLSLCLNVRNTSPQHGLTNEQMSPYIARVISHPRNWSIHTMALLLRSRLEANRTRTVERSVLQLQALVDQMPTADSAVTERLAYVHSIPLPSKWEMQRELAARFLSIGVVKSALEIFERLEMWEDAVKCYQAMEQRDVARTLVRDLLEGRKATADAVLERGKGLSEARLGVLDATREAKLWCLLGELEPENAVAHFEKAWQVSRGMSGRAMRSLGGYYFARGHYADAVRCLRKAIAINPLQVRSWFILGCASVRVEDWAGGRDAFARCVALDEEDGESWNNLASVYLRMGNIAKKDKAKVRTMLCDSSLTRFY